MKSLGSVERREFLKCAAVGAALPFVRTVNAEPDVKVAGEYDLVVAGGSSTGVCAAVTAARAGLKVALVEYNSFFGGMATAALVPVWHSLWSTDGKTQIVRGLTEEIERYLLDRGEALLTDDTKTNTSVGCYLNVAAMQLALDHFVREEKNITPYLKAHVVAAEKDGETRLTGVVVEDKSGRRLIRGRWFVDATGDADLAVRAGFETYVLPKHDIQAHTLCAIVSGWTDLERRYGEKFSLNALLGPKGLAGLRHVFGWTAPVVGSPELRFIAVTRVADCDPSVASELTDGLMDARRQLGKLVDAVNGNFPLEDGRRLALVAVASDLGIRESRHIKAKYRVTEEDVLMGRRFEDCAAKGSYRVDIHEADGITFKYLNGVRQRMRVDADGRISWTEDFWRLDKMTRPTWYEMPLRSLMPEKAENLICAGRMVDCERGAYGALRVMVNCNQMGESVARHVIGRLHRG